MSNSQTAKITSRPQSQSRATECFNPLWITSDRIAVDHGSATRTPLDSGSTTVALSCWGCWAGSRCLSATHYNMLILW